ncbi:hypothetical protein CS063_09645 [Sporanaerobium hydrogeniformans]|uniref:Uncharacterized protein n=1 Tax=Sporanaerobium hydrogeniformans TaxID=3072179 RepID=A0AC61DBZ4_9FIRM|nr:hypothetical protein [Sporanaerobium hydrogeniformans]PHV70557.1 hypothetical protein CS063_09645 [Sporanaerobium hydrogeniformans]
MNMLPLLALGLLTYNSYAPKALDAYPRNESTNDNEMIDAANFPQEFVLPDFPPFNNFVSTKYRVSFKYPNTWVKNPRYADKYEGKTGFFEVSDLASAEGSIDKVVQDEINLPYKPYGSTPRVLKLRVDGQPARLIYPSSDQLAPLSDREAALIVEYKKPLISDGIPYPYVVVWSDKIHMPLIIKTFQFVAEEN